MNRCFALMLLLACLATLGAQPWEQDNSVFNPSGIPSLTFSQPRFADLDADGDQDFLLGGTSSAPLYVQNIGSATAPAFALGTGLLDWMSYLDAEMAVCADIDADGDLDLITGGFTGLHLFPNTGSASAPAFGPDTGIFGGINDGQYPVPDLADVDADGDLDLVVGFSENGSVKVYTNTGSATAGQFSEASMQVIGDVGLYAYPVFCDLDGDGDTDILCGRDGHGFIYYQNQGSASAPDWEPNNALFAGLGQDDYWNSPDLVDLNGDGLADLVHGTASGPLQCYMNTGSAAAPAWQPLTTLFGGVLDTGGASNPVFYDFDGDGDLDLISGSQLGYIKYYENTGSPQSPAWSEDSAYFASIDHSIYAAVTIGDLDGDGLPDAVVGDLNGGLYFHRNTGFGVAEEAGYLPTASFGGWSCPRLVDLDADGDLDLIVGNEAGNLRAFNNQGTPQLPDWNEMTGFFSGIDVGSNCVPSFADLDDDGDLDFVAGNMWGDLQCYLRQGFGWTQNTTLVAGITTDQNAAPALADLDGDGDLDLTVGDYDGTFGYHRNLAVTGIHNPPEALAYELLPGQISLTWSAPVGSTVPFALYRVYIDAAPFAETNSPAWQIPEPELGHTYHVEVTAMYEDGIESAPAVIEIAVVAADDAIQALAPLRVAPNPARASAGISFEVKNGAASLKIFNARGQLLRVWNGLAPGKQELLWDCRDDRGRRLPSGVYLCRLETGEGVQTRRLLLAK